MIQMIIQRLLSAIAMMTVLSMIAFVLIQLPPGDYADAYAGKKSQGGAVMTAEQIDEIRDKLGLNEPMHVQYIEWISDFVQGDFGYSWEYHRPVIDVVAERMPVTLTLVGMTLVFTYFIAVPMGIYCALRQYSLGDHAISLLGYIGLAIPNFMFALILLYLSSMFWGTSAGGLFSPDMQDAPWSWEKFTDMMAHIWVPVVVLGTAGTAFQIRTMRATLLDELNKMYVTAARATGMDERKVIMKYPVRMALNPVVSTLGWELTNIISGAPIVGVVMSLPDMGPLFLNSLLNQDMYLAGALVMVYCLLVIAGTLISDLLLMLLDPRIRMGAMKA